MSNITTVTIRNLDKSKLSFVQGVSKDPKRKAPINFHYDGKWFQLRTGKMKFPFGVNKNTDEKTGKVSYALSGVLTGMDPYGVERSTADTDTAKLYNLILDLEKDVLAYAVENSAKLFGKQPNGKPWSQEVIESKFNRILKISKMRDAEGAYVPSGKYAPSVKFTIPVYPNKDKTRDVVCIRSILDSNGRDVAVEPETLDVVFPKFVELDSAIIPSIYVIGDKAFGVSFKLNGVKLSAVQRSAGGVFDEEMDDDETAEDYLATKPEEAVAEAPKEETEDLPPLVPAPTAPAKTPKKRVPRGPVE